MESFTGKRFHIIGIGGIGTSGLAKVLLRQGAFVSGSDMTESAVTRELHAAGANITIGHRADNLRPPLDAVIISAAIPASNPELARAFELGLKIYKYAEMLGKLFDQHFGIAIAGTHGKSTTSAWIAYLLQKAGLKPNFIVGADIPQLGGSSGVGNGTFFVAEACEYDRSFLNLHPSIGIILNIEQDHLDYYRDEDEIVEAFGDFASQIKPDGWLIANGSDKNVQRILRRLKPKNVLTIGFENSCDFYADEFLLDGGTYRFTLKQRFQPLGQVHIQLPGKHNVYNAIAATVAALYAGAPLDKILSFLPEFCGIDRRLMLKGTVNGITILDDYAHHPTEIRASLQAIRQRYNPKRLWCIFQPHQYSRTRFLLDDFAESFKLSDKTIVPEIYFVRDTLQSKMLVNAQMLVERINQQRCMALFIPDFASIVEYLKQNAQAGDVIVTMGAGTIWKVADEYLQWLREHHPAQCTA